MAITKFSEHLAELMAKQEKNKGNKNAVSNNEFERTSWHSWTQKKMRTHTSRLVKSVKGQQLGAWISWLQAKMMAYNLNCRHLIDQRRMLLCMDLHQEY